MEESVKIRTKRKGKRKKGVVLALLIMMACALAVIIIRGPEEPAYGGVKLSEWIEQLHTQNADWLAIQESKEALKKIGVDAIPFIQSDLMSKEPILPVFFEKLNGWLETALNFHQALTPIERHNRAVEVCMVLGPKAKDLVPLLINELNRTNPTIHPHTVLIILRSIGPDAKHAIPHIILIVDHKEEKQRANAIMTLGKIHTEPQKIIPILKQKIETDTDYVVRHAIGALGSFGKEAKAEVPFLIPYAEHQNFHIRGNALWSLGNIGENPEQVIPVLINALNDSHHFVYKHAILALAKYGDHSQVALDNLKPFLTHNEATSVLISKLAILEISPEWIIENFDAETLKNWRNEIEKNRQIIEPWW